MSFTLHGFYVLYFLRYIYFTSQVSTLQNFTLRIVYVTCVLRYRSITLKIFYVTDSYVTDLYVANFVRHRFLRYRFCTSQMLYVTDLIRYRLFTSQVSYVTDFSRHRVSYATDFSRYRVVALQICYVNYFYVTDLLPPSFFTSEIFHVTYFLCNRIVTSQIFTLQVFYVTDGLRYGFLTSQIFHDTELLRYRFPSQWAVVVVAEVCGLHIKKVCALICCSGCNLRNRVPTSRTCSKLSSAVRGHPSWQTLLSACRFWKRLCVVQRFQITPNTAEITLGGTKSHRQCRLRKHRLLSAAGGRCLTESTTCGCREELSNAHLSNLWRTRNSGGVAPCSSKRWYALR
jgi:hypothetical protein